MCVPETVQSPPYSTKKCIVIYAFAPQANLVQAMGHGKYDVIVLYRKGTFYQLFNPYSLFGALAFGTVPVATTVIAITGSVEKVVE